MDKTLRILTWLLGGFYALQGVFWLVAPEQAAAGLGMSLLEGVGRSTQVGDFTAFFAVLGGSILFGARAGSAGWLHFPAALLASAALFRSIAWAVHGAAFATAPIVIELISAAILLAAARRPGAER